MISTLFIVYRILAAGLALIVIYDIVREKSLSHAINLGIVSVTLILRALLIK